MKKCVDCDYKFDCGKANSKMVCEKYKKTPKTVTKLNKIEEGYFEFERLPDDV